MRGHDLCDPPTKKKRGGKTEKGKPTPPSEPPEEPPAGEKTLEKYIPEDELTEVKRILFGNPTK